MKVDVSRGLCSLTYCQPPAFIAYFLIFQADLTNNLTNLAVGYFHVELGPLYLLTIYYACSRFHKTSSNLPTAENENLLNFREAGSRIWDKSVFGEYMIS